MLPPTANLNDQDKDGDTALNWACLNSNVKTVEVLLKAGADPNLQGPDGGALGNARKAADPKRREQILALLKVAEAI